MPLTSAIPGGGEGTVLLGVGVEDRQHHVALSPAYT